MNPRDLDTPHIFAPADFARARDAARTSGRRVVDCLEADTGLDADDFVRSLAAALSLPAVMMDALHAAHAAFDVLPYSESMAHEYLYLFQSAQT